MVGAFLLSILMCFHCEAWCAFIGTSVQWRRNLSAGRAPQPYWGQENTGIIRFLQFQRFPLNHFPVLVSSDLYISSDSHFPYFQYWYHLIFTFPAVPTFPIPRSGIIWSLHFWWFPLPLFPVLVWSHLYISKRFPLPLFPVLVSSDLYPSSDSHSPYFQYWQLLISTFPAVPTSPIFSTSRIWSLHFRRSPLPVFPVLLESDLYISSGSHFP